MTTDTITIDGMVAPGFEPVRDAFAANFSRDDKYREHGAALAVYKDGDLVVNLWGGARHDDMPWTEDTLVNVFSTTKGMAAAAIAAAVDRGLLSYDMPVQALWPEFQGEHKDKATVSHALSHQIGLTGFDTKTRLEDIFDWNTVTGKLAAQPLQWVPGENTSYHAATYGWIVGEILRRATGKSVRDFVKEALADPLGADIHIGLPAGAETRVSDLIAAREAPDVTKFATMPPVALMALRNPTLTPEAANRADWRAAEMPAINGHASAHGVARLYGAIANSGTLGGTRILSEDVIGQMTEVQSDRTDMLMGRPTRWARGFSYSTAGAMGPDSAFGHAGWGGSFGAADRETGLGVGYVMNQMGGDLVGDARVLGLTKAIWDCA
ncbi:serine hydrolase domain-containing protein [Kordiimonas marina]|uniref:serine hydrolase domain-containing protein n=1 Tax=Kordiimonas marina TaxID=2872312 RepID=UPI001FF6CEBB|nr:serine hydrolase domain-containing protein [Kordiimonas marina]MCJ9430142.1 beta-lactamase family protein [Kordiimonas marina]